MSGRATETDLVTGAFSYRVKALVEQALATAGVPYAIVRPTFFFALGHISFLEWLNEHRRTLGGAYANELDRHFRRRRGI